MEKEKKRSIREQRELRRRNELIIKCVISLLVLIIILLSVLLIKEAAIPAISGMITRRGADSGQKAGGREAAAKADPSGSGENDSQPGQKSVDAILEQAEAFALQYDYDGAIAVLQNSAAYDTSTQMQNKVADYRSIKETLHPYPLEEITHVFFHTMIHDPSRAFDGDAKEAGYNQVMTTMSEFEKIMQTLYEKGYVMVSLHDMCKVNEDGTVSRGEILLPPGKTPFVLSQDDVSYYHYMDGDGFASRLTLDENGKVKNAYIQEDGTEILGDFDMVPWVDTFVEQHPDFSYHGHKGIIALTGYEGVLGYRTDEVYRTREAGRVTEYQQKFFNEHPDFDEAAWQREVDMATKVAQAMKAEGWEFASHTWGHISPASFGLDATRQDTERWLANVGPIVGDIDVIIFAFGADIGDWHPYSSDNSLFTYFKSKGFNIYCNVDSSKNWVQFGDNFMRQGRRNLDGYRMYYNPEMLSDLFDVDAVWDDSRPTPVPPM